MVWLDNTKLSSLSSEAITFLESERWSGLITLSSLVYQARPSLFLESERWSGLITLSSLVYQARPSLFWRVRDGLA